MSKKFYAVNSCGERWTPQQGKTQYLVMYDSGHLAIVTEDFYTHIEPLDRSIWKTVIKDNFRNGVMCGIKKD